MLLVGMLQSGWDYPAGEAREAALMEVLREYETADAAAAVRQALRYEDEGRPSSPRLHTLCRAAQRDRIAAEETARRARALEAEGVPMPPEVRAIADKLRTDSASRKASLTPSAGTATLADDGTPAGDESGDGGEDDG